MKIKYDSEANAAYIRRFDSKIIDSEEVAPGIIYDYDESDRVIGIEILGFQQRTPKQIQDLPLPLIESEQQELKQWLNSLMINC